MLRSRPSAIELLEDFENYLLNEKKLKRKTVNRHLGNLDLYINVYLNNYEDMHPIDSGDNEIRSYLGDWYIRKVINSKRSDVIPILASFKKFYKYLHEKGYIDDDNYEYIKDVCKNSKKFQRRFDTYQQIDFDKPDGKGSWIEWVEWSDYFDEEDEDFDKPDDNDILPILETLLLLKKDYLQHFRNSIPVWIHSLSKFPKQTINFLQDFSTFLTYCEDNSGMKVSKRLYVLQRKHIIAINSKFSNPETLKPNVFQWDTHLVNLFYHMAKFLGCIQIDDKYSLQATDTIKTFKSLTLLDQLYVCLFSLWEGIDWNHLLPQKTSQNTDKRPCLAQDLRVQLLRALANSTPNYKYIYKNFFSKNLNEDLNFQKSLILRVASTHGVFPNKIIPSLEKLGLVIPIYEFGRNEEDEEDEEEIIVTRITISKFGKGIFSGFLKAEELFWDELKLSKKMI